MKRFLFILLLTIFLCPAFAQNLTGIWRGSFYAGKPPFQEYYKYEVQIDQQNNNSIRGVTYSYRTTVFYGKAIFEGIWFPKTGSALIKELKLVELKMERGSDACAMTCDLEYAKENGKETLSGTFTSININSKTDCGSGTVYLERVEESDFQKEDFLLKKKPGAPSPEDRIGPKPSNKNNIAASNTKKLQSALGVPADGVAGPKTMAALKRKLPDVSDAPDFNDTDAINKLVDRIKKANTSAPLPPAATPAPANDIAKANTKRLQAALDVPADGVAGPKTIAALKKKLPDFNGEPDVANTSQVNDLISRIKKANAASKNATPVNPPVAKPDTVVKTQPPAQAPDVVHKEVPVPDVIKTRSNPLIKTITTNSPDIKIELYDNGDIDGDTITVYHNNKVIAWKKGLTDKPVVINVKADAGNTMHEFVMVADNLGSIPPNTALMIITTGGKRYQLFVSSDTQKNAKVVVEYQP
ncbi:hypothetical protein [Parafilimonas sp.]|uniref:peptidoglycan-binding domain-containing protein n=1 Tax=Parafilimonas sp. TaxID=1969739 RepID=UPI0039E2907E